LRQALEAALAVAREGEEETPAVPAPVPLRPFLRFAKLPPAALAATRRVLDTDEEFRERVAEAVDEDDVGRGGWLFLSRPHGWREEFDSLVAGAEAAVLQEADRKAENDARRRLAGAEDATRRSEQAAAAARAEARQATTALAEERRARQQAADDAAAAARKIEHVTGERDRARTSAATAATERDEAKAAAIAAAQEADTLRRRVADLEAELRRQQEFTAPPSEARQVEATDTVARNPEAARALREAAAAARNLASALGAAAAPLDTEVAPPAPPSEAPAPAPAPARPRLSASRRRSAPRAGRVPVRLPPAMFDDSVEAAEHLVRVPGVVLVVDGYNASQTGWPDLPLVEQRRHLQTALAELAARTSADVRLVFDGAEVQLPGIVPSTAQTVRVSFSRPGVEADDEILTMLGDLPDSRPVVVATSDRRVQTGAAAAGANVISSPQLLAVLRR
jgi:predicted RNA-binding protein with PIN domain